MLAIGDAELAHATLENDMLADGEDIVPRLEHLTNT